MLHPANKKIKLERLKWQRRRRGGSLFRRYRIVSVNKVVFRVIYSSLSSINHKYKDNHLLLHRRSRGGPLVLTVIITVRQHNRLVAHHHRSTTPILNTHNNGRSPRTKKCFTAVYNHNKLNCWTLVCWKVSPRSPQLWRHRTPNNNISPPNKPKPSSHANPAIHSPQDHSKQLQKSQLNNSKGSDPIKHFVQLNSITLNSINNFNSNKIKWTRICQFYRNRIQCTFIHKTSSIFNLHHTYTTITNRRRCHAGTSMPNTNANSRISFLIWTHTLKVWVNKEWAVLTPRSKTHSTKIATVCHKTNFHSNSNTLLELIITRYRVSKHRPLRVSSFNSNNNKISNKSQLKMLIKHMMMLNKMREEICMRIWTIFVIRGIHRR